MPNRRRTGLRLTKVWVDEITLVGAGMATEVRLDTAAEFAAAMAKLRPAQPTLTNPAEVCAAIRRAAR